MKGAMDLAEQLRTRVASYSFVFEGEKIPITISIGVATMGNEIISSTDFIKRVDEQLYRAKADGRNCIRG
jgi:diguanylate cyclase (GGDEF)-like protein